MENKIIMDYLLSKLNGFIGEINYIIEDIEKSNKDVSRYEEIYSFKNMLCDASNIREIEAEKKEEKETTKKEEKETTKKEEEYSTGFMSFGQKIDKNKFLDYIQENFNINVVSRELIATIIDISSPYNINNIMACLNNCRIDIEYDEIVNNGLLTDESYFIEEQYEKMKKWIFGASNDELKEHYEWYDVVEGDRVDLLNNMFESYCNTYDNEELEKRCDDLLKGEN